MKKSLLQYMKIIFLSKVSPLWISLFASPVYCAPCLFTFFLFFTTIYGLLSDLYGNIMKKFILSHHIIIIIYDRQSQIISIMNMLWINLQINLFSISKSIWNSLPFNMKTEANILIFKFKTACKKHFLTCFSDILYECWLIN